MSISEHEQQVLETIENDLASAGPKLAAMLAMFARLTAGEEMPVRERVRRGFDPPSAAGPGAASAGAAGPPARPRRVMPRLRRQSAWLVWLVVAIALIGSALAANLGSGKGACPATRTAACRQVPGSAGPGGIGNGAL